MPWTVADVDKHRRGLDNKQKRQWVAVANSAMQRCRERGGSNCEGQAIRMANGVVARRAGPAVRKEITSKGHDGAIVCFYLPEKYADEIHAVGSSLLGGRVVPKDELHVTLQYLGNISKLGDQNSRLLAAVTGFVSYLIRELDGGPLTATIGGIGRFNTNEGGGENCVYLSVDSPQLNRAWEMLCNQLAMAEVKTDNKHGFTGHITVGYIPEDEPTPFVKFEPIAIELDEVTLALGDICYHFPLAAEVAARSGEYGMRTASKAVWTTAFVNDLPDSSFLYIEAGGKKDSDGKTAPRSKRHFPYRDAGGKIDLPHLRNAIARIPQSNAPGLNKEALQARARRLLASSGGGESETKRGSIARGSTPRRGVRDRGDTETKRGTIARGSAPKRGKSFDDVEKSGGVGFTVFKQDDGKLRWVMFSSNPYEDRDEEYVTQKAQEFDIELMDKTGDYGVLRWWHVGKPYFEKPGDWLSVKAGPGLDLGVCDFAAMHGRIRVESGTFYSEKVGEAVAASAPELEGSLGYAHPDDEPDAGGGYLHIKTFERSLTPKGKASNLFTSLLVESGDEAIMDNAKKKALRDLGVDIDDVLQRSERMQAKADERAPYRMKSSDDDADADADRDLAHRLDGLYDQLASLQQTIKEGAAAADEPEQRLEDLMLHELTVGEFQDVIKGVVATKSTEPIAVALKAIFEEIQEVKEILTSKSVQSVVDDVGRMKAKLERVTARMNGIGSKVREMSDEQPRILGRNGGGVRPSVDDETIFSDLEDGDLTTKSGSNPFSWIDDFIVKDK